MNRTTILSAAVLAGLAGGVLAAPPPKDARVLPPPTPEQWGQSQTNLKLIGLAIHNYESAYGYFPNNVVAGGKPLLSWRVSILPYLEEEELYRQFKLDEPWDGETNKKLAEKLPAVFAPVRVKAKAGETFYRGFAGPGAVFEKDKRIRIASIVDGTSNTALAVEAGEPVVWTKPDDLPFDLKKDLPKLGGLFDGEFNLLMCDGSVRRVRKDFDAATLKLVIQRDDGQPVDLDKLAPEK